MTITGHHWHSWLNCILNPYPPSLLPGFRKFIHFSHMVIKLPLNIWNSWFLVKFCSRRVYFVKFSFSYVVSVCCWITGKYSTGCGISWTPNSELKASVLWLKLSICTIVFNNFPFYLKYLNIFKNCFYPKSGNLLNWFWSCGVVLRWGLLL